ncbi:MAG: TonB family protein [Bacteroidota bacterium]|nr:TonB family protein [Bacteroidota bacterium]
MNWWHYLLLVNIYLLVFYGFYVLLLRKETFFQLNRIYLVAAALLSFLIPLIQSDWVKQLFITQQVQYTIYSSPVMFYQFKPIEHTQITYGQMGAAIYLAGIAFLIARFAWQLLRLKKMINQPQPAAAYSFFKKIRLGGNLLNRDVIAAHEGVHANQWHSADILMMELIMVINWFNPVVYFYRFAIKHIHEFIADQQALKSGTDKADYALLLLSQTFNAPAHRLVNPFFNHSLLKQRIIMLQKNRSNRAALVKYGFSAPLFILMLILSSATISNSPTVRLFDRKAGEIFWLPATTAASEISPIPSFPSSKSSEQKISRLTHSAINKTLLIAVADTTPDKNSKIFDRVDRLPEFPGGLNAFMTFLRTNIKYPEHARKNKVQGRVIITFVVEKDGSLTNIRVARGVKGDVDQEAIRVIQMSPKWKPGIQNGKFVRVAYAVPIAFSLEDAKTGGVPENKRGSVVEGTTVPAYSSNHSDVGDDKVFSSVEQVPEFPGGIKAFSEYLGKNTHYPAKARENNVQGRVIVSFVVEKDGTLTDVHVARGIDDDIDQEALRVINRSPKWIPGRQNGHLVRVVFSVPINFTLSNDNTDKSPENKTEAVTEGIKFPRFPSNKTNIKTYVVTDPNTLHLKGMSPPPLYIVDGKETKDISNLNPADIYSIAILKGKLQTAFYGPKGAPGVVRIVTKSNKLFKPVTFTPAN